jgi:hypothetical protein
MSKPQPTSRFIINEHSEIVDMRNQFPSIPACSCDVCQELTVEERSDQSYLRGSVLKAQLASLTQRVEFLNEAQAHALAQVIYWTICVSGVDLRISGARGSASIDDSTVGQPASPELTSSPFLEDVQGMLKDLYDDCDPDFLRDVVETVSAVAIQWNRALTTVSRSYLRRLSRRENVIPFDSPNVVAERSAVASSRRSDDGKLD